MSQPASIGLFSQILSPSSTVRWILPARIRSKSQNDVVFVGQNFVQLREFLPNGQLADVTAKVEFGAQILSAKVISAKLDLVPIMDQILQQTRDDERFLVNGREIDDKYPPQVVVMSIASSELVFLYAKDISLGTTRFVCAKKYLLRDVSLAGRYGAHIAVDSESRAIAVAPALGYCGVFGLKTVDEIQVEIDRCNASSSHVFEPTQQDRFFQINGLILKMDFLPSTPSDPNKLILLLLVSQKGNTYLHLYRWDVRRGPKHARTMRCSGQRLPTQDALPLMLIPSSRCPSFIIVTESHLAVYDNVLSASARRVSFPLRKEVPTNFESSSVAPLWVQWAKPRRHADYLKAHDDFYLVREDGELRYYMIDHSSTRKVEAYFSPGSLGISIDTAFAMLAGPVKLGADIFIAGGDLTDGGVFHCTARKVPVCVQTLPNLAPMRDMLITQPHEHFGRQYSGTSRDEQRFFTCSGKESQHSYVNEIRFGLQAQVGWTIEHPESLSATRLWILQDNIPERVLFLLSHPLQSSLLSLNGLTLDVEVGDAITYPAFDLDVPTLAAASIPKRITVQITRLSTNLSVLGSKQEPKRIPHKGIACISATINAASSCFALANRKYDGFELIFGRALMIQSSVEAEFGTTSFEMDIEPTCLSLTSICGKGILLVGSSEGTLYLLRTDVKRGLHLLSKYDIRDLDSAISSSSISSLGVLSRQNSNEALVVCGLRTGILLLLTMKKAPNPKAINPTLILLKMSVLGTTSVTITEELTIHSAHEAAFITCGSDMQRISLLDETGLQFAMSPVWITSSSDQSSSQPIVNALCRAIDHPAAEINGLLICASQEGLIVSSLVLQDQAVPRRFKVSGPPLRLAYSNHLKKLVVAFETILTAPNAKAARAAVVRKIRPALQLIDPDEPDALKVSQDNGSILRVGDDGDRIRALLDWEPTDGTFHYEMILLGIDTDAADDRPSSGRLLYVNVQNMGKMPLENVKVGTPMKYPNRPVFSLAAHGNSALLVGAGNDIFMESFDVASRKWSTLSTFTLPSAATSITSVGPLVYVSTMHHSLSVLRYRNDQPEQFSSDAVARNTTAVICVENEFSLISTISNEGTTLVAFYNALVGQPPASGKTEVAFDAHIPLILERMKQSERRSTSKDARKTFKGITLDGTIYRFKTLQQQEWQLLQLIERRLRGNEDDLPLSIDGKRRVKHRMHVPGDLLSLSIEPGPYNLRHILGKDCQYHDQKYGNKDEESRERELQLRTLTTAVLGRLDDPIAGLLGWLRELMSIPQ